MKKDYELIANIILIITGIIAGTIFYFIDAKSLSSIFFAMALASILYQFLGGIGDSNSISLGAVKFGGSAAVLLGFIYYLNDYVFSPPETQHDEIAYSQKNWIPINTETGKTLSPPLTIALGNKVDTFPKPGSDGIRALHNFKVLEVKNNKFALYISDTARRVGFFNISDLSSESLFNNIIIDKDETNVQIFTLKPDSENLSSTRFIKRLNLPFEIRVFNESRFSITIDNKPLEKFKNREVVPRTSYIIPVSDDEIYVAFLEQASNIVNDDYPERYSKWLVKKLRKNFTNKTK